MKSLNVSRDMRLIQVAIGVCVVGLIIRLVVSGVSIGSNDTPTWMRFGLLVHQHGLPQAYHHDTLLNHPPIPTLWAAGAYAMTWWEPHPFGFLMRLPAIAGDLLTSLLLWQILRHSHGAWTACIGVAVFALSPAAILISAYHSNTDSLCVALSLLALHLASRDKPGWAGIALGAAINIKLLPVLLIPLLLLRGDWRSRFRTFAALSVCTIPFLVLFAFGGSTTITNMVTYGSSLENWGIVFVLRSLGEYGVWEPGYRAASFYHDHLGKALTLLLVCVLAFIGRQRVGPIEAGAQTNAWFLALAPGFGVQYLVYATTLILASAPRLGFYLTAVSGLFAAGVYYTYLQSTDPFYSVFAGKFRFPPNLFGLMSWTIITTFAIIGLWYRVRPIHTPTPPPANR